MIHSVEEVNGVPFLTMEYVEGEMLEKAVALDPGFLQAWTELSSHHSYWYMVLDKTEARLAKPRAALQQAEAIDPDHPSTHLARGDYFYRGLRDYDQALEEYETASRLVPNDSRAMTSIAYIYRRQGKWDPSLERLEAAFELDPQNATIARDLAETNRALRRFDVAVPLYERAEQLNPQNYRARFNRAMAMVAWTGDLSAASEILAEMPKQGDPWYHIGWMMVHLYSHEFPEAMAQARLLDDGSPVLHSISTNDTATFVSRYGIVDPDAPSLEDAPSYSRSGWKRRPPMTDFGPP